MWLFQLKVIKIKLHLKFSSSAALALFQVPACHMWLLATTADSTEGKHCHLGGRFYWTCCERPTELNRDQEQHTDQEAGIQGSQLGSGGHG